MRKVDKLLLDLVCASEHDDVNDEKLISAVKAQHAKTHAALKNKQIHEEIFLQAAKMGKTSFMEYAAASIGVIDGIRPSVLYKLITEQHPTNVIETAEKFARKPTAEVLSDCVGQKDTIAFDFAMARYALKPGVGAFKQMLKISDKEVFDLWYAKLMPFFQGKKKFVVDGMCLMFGFARDHMFERLKMLHRDGFEINIDDLKNYTRRYVHPNHPLQDFAKTLVQKRGKERAAATRAYKNNGAHLQKLIVKK